MSENQKAFQYTYSAKEQEEIKRIRSRYMPKEENKMELLRRLDAQVSRRAAMLSVTLGVTGALILGTGMSCCLVWSMFVPGIAIGAAGLVGIALAYPLYERTLKREREKAAPQILRLTEELMK